MKTFKIIKVGYSAGVYGNTGEYFTCIYTDGDQLGNFDFYGQYGSEHRIGEQLQKLGYKGHTIERIYGKVNARESQRYSMSESSAILYIKNGFTQE